MNILQLLIFAWGQKKWGKKDEEKNSVVIEIWML